VSSDRVPHPENPPNRKAVGLPVRPFLFSLEQVSVMLDLDVKTMISAGYAHLEGRSIGAARRDQFIARNIAPPDQKPEWRVAELELIRWLRRKGFRYYDRGAITY